MKLKFIGEDGSMGLKYGKRYVCKVMASNDVVCVRWFYHDENLRQIGQNQCLYDSFAAMFRNWEE